MSGNMDSLIINEIQKIRTEVQKKPNTARFYNFMKRDDETLLIEDFIDSLRKLEDSDLIFCKGEGNEESFFVNKKYNENLSNDVDPPIEIVEFTDTSTTGVYW